VADILVVIPSYNSAATVAYVVSTAARGLKQFFPEGEHLILVSDGGSVDGTLEVVKSLRVEGVKVSAEHYTGPSGKGSAIFYGLEKAAEAGFDAVIMLDSDLRSVEPWWIKLLGRTAQDYDLITPLYARHKHDGTITNCLAYPIVRAIYRARVRQPIGGDFGIGRKLASLLLERRENFEPSVHGFGIDFYITSTALAENMRVAQADLGTKLHEAKDPSVHLRRMFFEVAETVIKTTLEYKDSWSRIVKKKEVGFLRWKYTWKCPQQVVVDVDKACDRFIMEIEKCSTMLERVLGDMFSDLVGVKGSIRARELRAFPDELWARAVYLHMAAYRKFGREVLEGLYALWLGKVASHILDTLTVDDHRAEKRVEEYVQAFEKERSFLEEIL